MAEFTYSTRQVITRQRADELMGRIGKFSGKDKELALELKSGHTGAKIFRDISREFYENKGLKPSQWFGRKGILPASRPHQGLLDAFVPKRYQPSYLYIIDKLNQFPFSRGWRRRSMRTAGYGPQSNAVFLLLLSFEQLFYCGDKLEDYMLNRLDPEKLDYIQNTWNFGRDFSYLYAAEIDLGNQSVIQTLKDLILSENNTAYLNREMILGIIRSDNQELHELLCKLLLAARLQEGLRQVICEAMDEGTPAAFERLLKVIEDNDLIRFSSVKRAVSTWIGIFDETSVDRVNGKMLNLMGQCLRDKAFCFSQIGSNDSIAISAGLWALGFREAEEAISAMEQLVEQGTKNQKLTASFYNQNLYDQDLSIRVAQKVIWEHIEDIELVTAFMPAFLQRLSSQIYGFFQQGNRYSNEIREPQHPSLTDFYRDREEAEGLYQRFMDLYIRLPKKGIVYDPCIFPWYKIELHPSEVICQLAFLAYVLQDEEKITYIASLLNQATNYRSTLVNLLLYSPANQEQRDLVIEFMGNGETSTSKIAMQIVKKMTLSEEEYKSLEDMLRFKRSNLRSTLIQMIMDQPQEPLKGAINRLLKDKKEEKRSAGLDILLRLSKDEKQAGFFGQVKSMAALVENPTDKEKILIQEIQGELGESAEDKEGYGIYNPHAPEEIPEAELMEPKQIAALYLPVTEKEAVEKLKKLDNLVKENENFEYQPLNGDSILLGSGYRLLKKPKEEQKAPGTAILEDYPLADKFQRFYEEEIGSFETFMETDAVRLLATESAIKVGKPFYKNVFGRQPVEPIPFNLKYYGVVRDIFMIYGRQFMEREKLLEMSIRIVSALTPYLNQENCIITYSYEGFNGHQYQMKKRVSELPFFSRAFSGLKCWKTDEEFTRAFYTAWRLELACQVERKRRRFAPDNGSDAMTPICPYWFFKACHIGLISMDIVYKAMMEYFNRIDCLTVLCRVVKKEAVKPLNGRMMRYFFGHEMTDEIYQAGEAYFSEDSWLTQMIVEAYNRIVPVIVDTELRRGEKETEFSWDIRGVTYIAGIDTLIRILMALGKDTLSRDAYYYWYYHGGDRTKKDALSSLLKSCYPAEGETGADLKKALKGTSIKEARLVEVAMYAPQWIDIIQEYLGWAGLKSGCYYFMAHMNERFDDQKKAIIAKYTPLTPEELQDGAFDAAWFEEAYGLLGEKNFHMLYQAAKYVSDGQKHSRARKYADAAAGKVKLSDLEREISAKRNKDLLMSYGLVPFGENREQEILDRYQFIQQYRKESRQFGAQRRASEGKAAELALVNLSVRAGFSDVTRLTLNVEGRLAESFGVYRQWTAVEDVEICLYIGEDGKSQILCHKRDKELKSVPSRLGKNPYVLEVKEAHKKLKEQYSRTKKMMEESMESGEGFSLSEIEGLMANPVVRAILAPLVFVGEQGQMGFFAAGEPRKEPAGTDIYLEQPSGEKISLTGEENLRIAHPLDLYASGQWHDYQKYLFARQIRQPFKQVFRELYVKLPEELGLKASRMFAGNQIQPKKTVACLRDRRWVADYEEGLQKIYYKENIIARIYALADWFSPGDVEEPTLEWVEFFDRKTFNPLLIEQVPDRIYSEVMRDVDLAVSVAHAGGVDPETSHSTVEMRRAIVEFNLPLFGLTNVVLKENHAIIQGTRGVYNVHLGSGVIHQEGGAMLNILPVHSQKRGKLFLPFVDEDPKTAEIMSKIVLLAEDKKIKDPFILDQIVRRP